MTDEVSLGERRGRRGRGAELAQRAQRPETGRLAPMSLLVPAPRPAFTPIACVLPHVGTNGQVSTWGAKLAGTAPPPVTA